jgi:Tlde1 domain
MWEYNISSGTLFDAEGNPVATGYAGKGEGKNNPRWQAIHNSGPLPVGEYTIHPPVDTQTHGPFVLWLTPNPLNMMYGRSGFGIHGDRVGKPGTASDGCIILPRAVRERIWESGDHRLVVTA